MKELEINSKVVLNNGVKMPQLGLGTWQATSDEVYNAVLDALKEGYRHIDTARIYGNEADIGRAIKDSKVPRKDLFVTTKLWNTDHSDIEKALNDSLKRLGLDYVDLYLMHWPVKERLNSWKVMEKLYKSGKCKAIGVSNFTVSHLQELLTVAKVKPAVNQFELTPYLYQKDLCEFCKKNKIQVESYSPLSRGYRLQDSKLIKIANKYNKSTPQILIRWQLQHGFVTIPKSKTHQRIKENSNVFDFKISKEDMNKLDRFNEDLRLCWDPNQIE
jgi:diketogulonate reductase-like aldo/keto reductase